MDSATGTYKWDHATARVIKISDRPRSYVPDVYFREEHFHPNLADDRHPFGQEIRSKMHKAKVMKDLDVREAGDRVHGARLKA